MHFQDLLAPVADEFNADEALEAWRWLVPQRVRPLVVTAFGDLFLVEDSGAVMFLDTIGGKCESVASSTRQLKQKIQEPDLLDEWFMPGFLDELRQTGVMLSPGECYSALHSVALGGSFTVENWQPTHWRVHFAFSGHLHDQIKDLPPGTKITKINFTRL